MILIVIWYFWYEYLFIFLRGQMSLANRKKPVFLSYSNIHTETASNVFIFSSVTMQYVCIWVFFYWYKFPR
jgi:hypothetical protein